MTPRYLLDTNVLLRWLAEPRKLSRRHTRILEDAERGLEQVAISAVTLMEIAIMDGSNRIKSGAGAIFDVLDDHPMYRLLPVTFDIASEMAALKALRDPADRAIVATARVHGLRLLTADQAILELGLAMTPE